MDYFKIEWEPMPGHWQFIEETAKYIVNMEFKGGFPESCSWRLQAHHYVYIVLCTLVLAFLRTCVNQILSKHLYENYNLSEASHKELMKKSWGIVFMAIVYPILCFSVYYEHGVFQRPTLILLDICNPDTPWDINLIYLLWSSFILLGTFDVLTMEDLTTLATAMHLLHHIVSLSLLTISYGFGYHKAGLLTLLTMETTNIPLRVASIFKYLLKHEGKDIQIIKNLRFIVWAVLVSSWFVFRLYLFPMRVLYTTGPIAKKLGYTDTSPYGDVIFLLHLSLLVLSVVWFWQIALQSTKSYMSGDKKSHEQ